MQRLRAILPLFLTAATAVMGQLTSIRCYACTTMNVDRLLSDVYDATWRRWLANVRFVPKSQQCGDFFEPELALRSGVRNQACNDGVCMKVWFKGSKGNNHIWRGCISKTQKQVRSDCTRILSSQGEMALCTCDSNLCNRGKRTITFSVLLLIIALFNCFLSHNF